MPLNRFRASDKIVPKIHPRMGWLFAPPLIASLVGILLLLLFSQPVQTAPKTGQTENVPSESKEVRSKLDGEDKYDVIVYLSEVNELSKAYLIDDQIDRRTFVVELLQANAKRTQTLLMPLINRLEKDGRLNLKQSFWVVNALHVEVDEIAMDQLAARPEVIEIKPNTSYQFISPTEKLLPDDGARILWNIARIMAPHVWHGLGIDGSGVTVAIMDTGVDWTHPDLSDNYRGNLGQNIVQHEGNWFDTVSGQSFPSDPNGHGTHVAGTAVGRGGIGVAPGAKWIAARILDEDGVGTIANIHAAFEWLLAPAGDPALSPDIVNNSWSGPPGMTDFIGDVEALKAAGIIPIFAAGNEGPEESTIGSPANYPGVVAIGATDDIDQVAWFSSRGPSLLTKELKPTFSAPGAAVLSASPGEAYKSLNGTSMATPHAAGVYALIKSLSPNSSERQITRILTQTAELPRGETIGIDIGWGRLNAYEAVSSLTDLATLQIKVKAQERFLPQEPITITTSLGHQLSFKTDDQGIVTAELLPGFYTVEVSYYGYAKFNSDQIELINGNYTSLDVSVDQIPHGTISGQLMSSGVSKPIVGLLRVPNTPLLVSTDGNGFFALELPVGTYEIEAESIGYKIARKQVIVSEETEISVDFLLEEAPRILLIDSGQWYYNSQTSFYRHALHENDLPFDLIAIRNPYWGAPSLEELIPYDLVIWSSPLDSPGLVGGGEALTEYLEEGGNLLISGQDVAYFDGQGPFGQYWWFGQLNGIYVTERPDAGTLKGGHETIFADLTMSLNGPDSAQNQFHPDISKPRANTFTSTAFRFQDGQSAGLVLDYCEPYRIVYLGFGLEGVSGSEMRRELMARSMELFSAPKIEIGAKFIPDKIEQIAPPGSTFQIDVDMASMSEILTDTFLLSLEGADWAAKTISDSVTIGPCQNTTVSILVSVPEGLSKNTVESFDLVARSSNDPSYTLQLPINLKTPTDLLLVDDDRWYDRAQIYRDALEVSGIDYDFWEIDNSVNDGSSPPLDLLTAYPFVIWFTGYDWFRPVTKAESALLYDYLASGGRLFLNSQDFLYYHLGEPLTNEFFNIWSYYESITPTALYGNSEIGLSGDLIGPLQLDFGQYQNFADGILVESGNKVSIWSDAGLPAGIYSTGANWRQIFWAVPFETIPLSAQPLMMEHLIGWLGDFGDSTFVVDKMVGMPPNSAVLTYTLTLVNANQTLSNTVFITNQLPTELNLVEPSLSGDAIYDPETRQISWKGVMQPGQQHLIAYNTKLVEQVSPGTRIDNSALIYYERHAIARQLNTTTWVGTGDLSSSKLIIEPSNARPGDMITITAKIVNDGYDSSQTTAKLIFNPGVTAITDSLKLSSGFVISSGNTIEIVDFISPGSYTSATINAVISSALRQTSLPVMLVLDDAMTDLLIVNTSIEVTPFRKLFPVIIR